MNTLDLIHAKIHGLRMIPKYKPTLFEGEINKLIANAYSEDCIECAEKTKELEHRSALERMGKSLPKKSFLGGLIE